jgi:hypothetical protein
MHAVTHILGFESGGNEWTDSTGMPHAEMTRTVDWRGTSNVVLVTPEVVSAARSYYGCSSLEGMAFE